MTIGDIEYRGWKEICAFLKVKDPRTAKSILVELGMLRYSLSNRPVLNREAYNLASMQGHQEQDRE
jgi:hypothetical protein